MAGSARRWQKGGRKGTKLKKGRMQDKVRRSKASCNPLRVLYSWEALRQSRWRRCSVCVMSLVAAIFLTSRGGKHTFPPHRRPHPSPPPPPHLKGGGGGMGKKKKGRGFFFFSFSRWKGNRTYKGPHIHRTSPPPRPMHGLSRVWEMKPISRGLRPPYPSPSVPSSPSSHLLPLRQPLPSHRLDEPGIIRWQSIQQIPYYLTTRWTHFSCGYPHSNRMVPCTSLIKSNCIHQKSNSVLPKKER